MADVGSVSSSGSDVTASVLRAAEQSPEVAATLLKKALDSDKDLVSTLLPAGGSTAGKLDIKA